MQIRLERADLRFTHFEFADQLRHSWKCSDGSEYVSLCQAGDADIYVCRSAYRECLKLWIGWNHWEKLTE